MKYQRQHISAYLFMLSISISSNANEQRLPITINPPLDSEIIEMLWKPSGLLYSFQEPMPVHNCTEGYQNQAGICQVAFKEPKRNTLTRCFKKFDTESKTGQALIKTAKCTEYSLN